MITEKSLNVFCNRCFKSAYITLKNMFFKIKLQMYSWWFIIVVVVVVILLSSTIYTFVNKKQNKERFTEANQKPKVVLVHASWCQHCVDYISNKKHDGKNAFDVATERVGSKVVFEKLDYDEHKDIAKQYGVSSFPAIVGVETNGIVKPFAGNRDDVSALVAFANSLT
jgi:thiol-disulfide isomerase/thioredoxin